MDNKDYLEKILPHKKPMVLIDDIIDYSFEEKWIKSVVTINENSIFYDSTINGISSIIGIEYMAQTIASYAFLKKQLEEPQIGYLLGTRLYNNLLDKFELGKTYTIKANEIYCDNDIVSFACIIYNENEQEVASATINAYQKT